MIKLKAAAGIVSILMLVGCMDVPKTILEDGAENTKDNIAAPTLGRMLTTGQGMTLYMHDPDKGAVCSDGCALWPPYGYARNDAPSASATDVKMFLIGFDELKVWAINGRPLHTFVGDKKPGDTESDGVGGWYIAREP